MYFPVHMKIWENEAERPHFPVIAAHYVSISDIAMILRWRLCVNARKAHIFVFFGLGLQTFCKEQHSQCLSVRHLPQFDIFIEVLAFTAHGRSIGHLAHHTVIADILQHGC